jgi:hypothetical protein
MKKIYLAVLSVVIAGSAFGQTKTAQSQSDLPVGKRVKQRIDIPEVISSSSRGGGGPIWSNDLSDPLTWTTGYDPTTCDLEWEIGAEVTVQGDLSSPYGNINSTSAANGFAMIDSDFYGGESAGNCVEDAWFQTAAPIDLTLYSNVVLEFETWYRRYNYERPYLVISTDGVTWPELTPDTDVSGMPNVFDLWPDFEDVTSLDQNPTLMRVNISDVAGNEPQIWVRFHWTGTWGYAWFVDDVKVVEQPANDLVTEYAFISHNGTGDEYGRIPQSQLLPNFSVGGGFYNFGFTDQNNCVATIDVVDQSSTSVMTATSNFVLAMADSTYDMDEVAIPSAPLALGLYEGTLTVQSDEENSGSLTFENNSYQRNFMVTEDSYSLDGIGTHPDGLENITSIGTQSFADAADGFMMFTYYDVSQEVAIMGLEILLSSSTVAGGTIICSINDTADVNADLVNLHLEQTGVVDILQEHIDAGMITVMFEEPFVAEPNGYFAGIEMFSNDNQNDIRIIDDITVVQPAGSSLIYTPDDETVYSNGNAAAIRLITADNVGISSLPQLEGISVYPNPTNGLVNVKMTNSGSYSLEVVNVLGEVVYAANTSSSLALNLTRFGKGVYTLQVSNEIGFYTERLIVQ